MRGPLRFVIWLVTWLPAAGCAPARPARPAVELVESWPVGTDLGHADLPDAHEVWPEMIRGARRTLDLATFYVSHRPGGRLGPVLAALREAGARGVRVRVLVDATFFHKYPAVAGWLGRCRGITLRRLDLSSRGGVMHAKYFVVDRREAFLGSHNLDWRSLEHIHELGVRVRVPEVARRLTELFELDWAQAGGAVIPSSVPWARPVSRPVRLRLGPEPADLRVVAGPPDLLPEGVGREFDALAALLGRARRTIHLELLSYRTTDEDGRIFTKLDNSLRRAAQDGVKVRLLVSEWSRPAPAHREGPAGRPMPENRPDPEHRALQELAMLPGITVRYLVIPPYPGGVIPFARVAHAKYLVVDGRELWISSSNWAKSYFMRSRNVGLVISSPVLGARLDRFFLHAFDGPLAEPLPAGDFAADPR